MMVLCASVTGLRCIRQDDRTPHFPFLHLQADEKCNALYDTIMARREWDEHNIVTWTFPLMQIKGYVYRLQKHKPVDKGSDWEKGDLEYCYSIIATRNSATRNNATRNIKI
jgi:hypothetical protein